jgi:hypothetical protein
MEVPSFASVTQVPVHTNLNRPIDPNSPPLEKLDDAKVGAVYMYYGATISPVPYPVIVTRKAPQRVWVSPYMNALWPKHGSFCIPPTSLRRIPGSNGL